MDANNSRHYHLLRKSLAKTISLMPRDSEGERFVVSLLHGYRKDLSLKYSKGEFKTSPNLRESTTMNDAVFDPDKTIPNLSLT